MIYSVSYVAGVDACIAVLCNYLLVETVAPAKWSCVLVGAGMST